MKLLPHISRTFEVNARKAQNVFNLHNSKKELLLKFQLGCLVFTLQWKWKMTKVPIFQIAVGLKKYRSLFSHQSLKNAALHSSGRCAYDFPFQFWTCSVLPFYNAEFPDIGTGNPKLLETYHCAPKSASACALWETKWYENELAFLN